MQFHVNRLYLDVHKYTRGPEDSYFCSTTYLTLFIMDILASSEDAGDQSMHCLPRSKQSSGTDIHTNLELLTCVL